MRNQTIGNLALSGFDDIFNSSTAILDGETVVEIPLRELFTPEQHPFQIIDDAEMTNLAASVKLNGVRDPGLAHPRVGGGYELLCGNRRKANRPALCGSANISRPITRKSKWKRSLFHFSKTGN
ncbi:MAG: hypothetical protein FWH33_11400 [Oscillospiraceae bacterium]|nr:hypothetical protein [Oscillospiraceae bacterium]